MLVNAPPLDPLQPREVKSKLIPFRQGKGN
jgi:hypothetical protein